MALIAGTLVAIRSSSSTQRVDRAERHIGHRSDNSEHDNNRRHHDDHKSCKHDDAAEQRRERPRPFYAAAAHEDVKLKATAALVNGDIGKTQVTFDQATVDAVRSLDPKAVADTIPNGLEPG